MNRLRQFECGELAAQLREAGHKLPQAADLVALEIIRDGAEIEMRSNDAIAC